MKIARRLLIGQAAAALLLALAFGATPALADAVVGDGTSAHCTESDFNTALAAGGHISFNCGPAPLTITFTSQKFIISSNITIDGGGLITLSGGNSTRLFAVLSGYSLTLKNIVLEKGNSGSNAAGGGAIYSNLSTVILDHATIQDSHTSNIPGGAIQSVGGTITLTNNSLIQNNNGYNYGAINTTGAIAIINSTIRNNTATNGGGGLSLGGLTTIDHSQIYSNTANGAAGGGGLFLTAPARISLTSSQVYSNGAPNSSGGGIENFGVLTMTSSSLSGNSADAGGGLSNENGATAKLMTDTVASNEAASYAGGLNNVGTLTLTGSTLTSNKAPTNGSGGGLGAGGSASTTLIDSTLSGNSAGSGGGISSEGGPLALTNVTLSGNTATASGGGLEASYGTATLTNVTFSGNSAGGNGGAIYFYAIGITDSLTLKNTLVADSPAGGNCYVSPDSQADIASAGFNLSTDTSCAPFFDQSGDINHQPARLFPLANNGGPTQTVLPRHDSPAINNGTGLGCPGADQRGLPRPAGGVCDIGAVEVQPTDRVWPLFLPTLLR